MREGSILLTRDEFRENVFARDRGRCVLCRAHGRATPAVDSHHIISHHIIERRLFPDGGYYLDNGASLCAEHHVKAETTEFSPEEIREAAGITTIVLPPHLVSGKYDKWGNYVLPNGQRMRGELFYDDSVQRVLGPFIALFTNRVKYPRTPHLPWSPGFTGDDCVLHNCDMSVFLGDVRVVVTEKFDGENTTLYHDGIHARSTEYHANVRRDWVRNFHASIAHNIPADMRICGENLFAQHSIYYAMLDSYFLGFSVWERDRCLSWDDTLEWFELLDIHPVRVIFDGPFSDFLERYKEFAVESGTQREGYVLRVADGFTLRDFRKCVAKYVRANHVQTDEHWMRQALVKNRLA